MAKTSIIGLIGIGAIASACASPQRGERVSTSSARLVALQEQKLQVADQAPGDRLGSAVVMLGDTAIVGAISDDNGPNSEAGSVRVFARTGTSWVLEQSFAAPDAGCLHFGAALAISSDSAFVGCPDPDGGSGRGAVYVLARGPGSWTLKQKLSAPGPGERFGDRLGLSGGTLAVSGNDVSVFAYVGAQWVPQSSLPGRSDAFAISGDTLVRSYVNESSGSGSGQGAAHVFTRAGSVWTEQQRVVASDAGNSDAFGSDLALDGDTLLVGASNAAVSGVRIGAAYVFLRSSGSFGQQAKLTAPDATNDDKFGAALALEGNHALIGATFHEHLGRNANHGSAYFFERISSVWVERNELLATDGQNNDLFGSVLAFSGNKAIVGAPNDDDAYSAVGSGYTFTLFQGPGDACTTNTDCAPGCSCAFGSCQGLCAPFPGPTQPIPDMCTSDEGIHCNANPCEHKGICTDTVAGHSCSCPPGVNGRDCEVVFTEIASTAREVCGVRSDGKLACWGLSTPEGAPPPGSFASISASGQHFCGVHTDGTAACWGYGSAAPPPLLFKRVAAGGDHDCGILLDGTLACWGQDPCDLASPPSGTFKALALSGFHNCGIRTDGTVSCWGLAGECAAFDHGQGSPPSGIFDSIAVSSFETCGVTGGTIACWGDNETGLRDLVVVGNVSNITIGNGYGCVLREGLIACSGSGIVASHVPLAIGGNPGFKALALGDYAGCTIRTDDVVRCFGYDMLRSPPTGSL